MESMITSYNSWNPNTLRKAKNFLLKNGNRKNNSEELKIITILLNNECKIVESEEYGNFSQVFQANNHLFEEEYAEYMKYIIDCYDKQREILLEEPYEKLDVSYEYIMAKLDNFMENLNPDWYDIFFELFTKRKDIIRFSNTSTETLYLPRSDLWLANIQGNSTIEDYANIVKVYGKGIAAKLRRNCAMTQDSEVLVQAFAKVIQYLFITKLEDYGIQGEVTKFFNKDFNENARRIRSVYEKFIIDTFVSNPKSANQVANLLSRQSIIRASKEHIEESYKKTVKKDIQKILTNLILRELLLTYESDKEKFVYHMNALVTSEENPAKTLEKLDIELNSIYYR